MMEPDMALRVRLVSSEGESYVSERVRIESHFEPLMEEAPSLQRLVSFVGNKTVPFLRLYRYKEAFSLEFVQRFLDYFGAKPSDLLLDPFAGMGTALFGAMLRGIPSLGVERLPIAASVAETLPLFFTLKPGSLMETLQCLSSRVDKCSPAPIADDVPLISVAFDKAPLMRLRQWKTAIEELEPPIRDVFRLLFLGALESTSYASNDGQFPRINKQKNPQPPDEAMRQKTQEAEVDLLRAKTMWPERDRITWSKPKLYLEDARHLSRLSFFRTPTMVITSPPYVNRYDYTRSYCLELCFHSVQNFAELRKLRHDILRSHIESKVEKTEKPNHPVIQEVVGNLGCRPLNNPRIPYMITAYFLDMEAVIQELGTVLAKDARVAMVVDNVRYEGELIPVDLVLSELAERHGFAIERILVARYKGNSSQQMGRFGRVPVRESVMLWRKQ